MLGVDPVERAFPLTAIAVGLRFDQIGHAYLAKDTVLLGVDDTIEYAEKGTLGGAEEGFATAVAIRRRSPVR